MYSSGLSGMMDRLAVAWADLLERRPSESRIPQNAEQI